MFRLLKEDSKIIKLIIKESGTTQEKIGLALGLNNVPSFNNRLSGKIRISQPQLTKLYKILGEPGSLRFLLDYNARLHPLTNESSGIESNTENAWANTYEQYFINLRRIYLSLPIENRHEVLSDLERLTEKYSQESDD